jgi:prolyl-tRNA synthetase
MVGAVVMVHGDDQGLILPPKLAPIQVVVVPIWRDEEQRTAVMEAVGRVRAALESEVRLKVDDREGLSPGWKFNDWEMRGVPLRIEVGPQDVAQEQVVLARRDRPGREGKMAVPLASLTDTVREMLMTIQADLYRRALAFREANTSYPEDFEGLREAVASGFACAWWCGDAACEAKVKEETTATIRCIPLEQEPGTGRCVVCGRESRERAVFARAY